MALVAFMMMEVFQMKRIDYCKQLMEQEKCSNEVLNVKFQEMNNFLPTYKEKKEFRKWFNEVKNDITAC